MLYSLIKYLDSLFTIPGARLFQYQTFRATLAIVLSLIIAIWLGGKIINTLKKHQIGESVRNLGLDGQIQKTGTPTMGGLLILLSTLCPVLLICKLDNIYIQLLLTASVWCGLLGFLDDYIKVFKHNKKGLKGWFKVFGQIGLGLIIGCTMCFSDNVVVREKSNQEPSSTTIQMSISNTTTPSQGHDVRNAKTTIPFVKNNEFDYGWFTNHNKTLTDALYILVAIFIVVFLSNGANLTDGLDGLCTGVSIPIIVVLGILAYLSGNINYADYLNIMYIPSSGEMIVFASAMVGALIGFMWYNSFPAQIFMGDTGSLAIGGIIAAFSLCLRKELLIPLMCGIFLLESLSVTLQVAYFKHTKKKYGEGRRIFLMTPIHHHYQKKGLHEVKIMMRFTIVSIILCAISFITLKIR
ncbi:MAG: phospho-N-acetylmuramoyl-pentapeptide-transferase [Alistipes sp.]|nr:phospho-N-acetylmuramoyl-pentapeptide-transferase [Candidatus Alistipes equi]